MIPALSLITYYEHFCGKHICMLIVIAAVICGMLLWVRRLGDKPCSVLVKCLSVLLFTCEMIQDLLLVSEGVDMMTILPLHLCNLGIFVNLAAAFSSGKPAGFFSEVSLFLNMPGALGAILFPDWNYRPFWNWLSLMCFYTHTLLVLLPLIFLVSGRSKVRLSHLWYSFAFMAVVTPFIAWLDFKFDHNYMFLRYPVAGSPLEWIYDLSEGRHYIIGLLILLVGVITVEYLIASGIGLLLSRKKGADQQS